MNKGIRNAILWILIGCLIAVVGGGLYHIATKIYLESIFVKEELTESYDGRFGYLQLSSPHALVCTLNIYDIKPQEGGKVYKQTLHQFFGQGDIEDISWGVQGYDLFFDTPELGSYIYTYISGGRWLGPLYFDINETEEKRLLGDKDAYCFKVVSDTNIEDFPDCDFTDVVVIKKEIIPKKFLKRIDSYIFQN